MIITKGDTKIWRFRFLEENSDVIIGIVNSTKRDKHAKGLSPFMHSMDFDSCGIYTKDGRIYSCKIDEYEKDYATRCDMNDILTMTLDMTGDEYGTVSFKMNDTDYGIAFDKIDVNKTYCMALSMFHPERVQLLE